MDIGVSVRLLGQARVQVGTTTIDFLPNKRFQLLAYLAYQHDWVSRDKLAFLFWPDETDHTARHNLRQLLKHVRKLYWLTGFEADEHRLRWQVNTDVALVKESLSIGKVEDTLTLYQGDLLSGLDVGGDGEFGEWLAMERESLHGRWRDAVLAKANELNQSGGSEQAAFLLHQLLERDPLDEEGLQAYMCLTSALGEEVKALSAYRAFAKRVAAEFGMEPTSSTEQLAEAIGRAPPSLVTQHHLAPIIVTDNTSAPTAQEPVQLERTTSPALPRPATSFLGRNVELGQIAHLLSQEDCRLLTLTGLGGAGKTRLAL